MNVSARAGAVIAKIEDIFESLLDCMLDGKKELAICLKSRGKARNDAHGDPMAAKNQSQDGLSRQIKFPGKTNQEARRFTVLLRILEQAHTALVTGVVITKRDIFYQDPELFDKQNVVDRYVDDLAYTLGVGRDDLNIVAAAKGLVCGWVQVFINDGEPLDCRSESEGYLIPSSKMIHSIGVAGLRWIAVVEKEACFRTLASSRVWETSACGKGVLITAKGYPDIQTRTFLKRLSLENSSVPIFGVVDFDPDGLGILSTYKHGSEALAHQREQLSIPDIRWLGVRSSDILSYSQQPQSESQGLLRLTSRDRRLASRMLEKAPFQGNTDLEWRQELQTMLMLNIKAEIQITSHSPGLAEWLDSKLKASGCCNTKSTTEQ